MKRPILYGLPVPLGSVTHHRQDRQDHEEADAPKEVKKAVKKKVKEMKEKKEHEPWDYKNYDTMEETLKSLDVFTTWRKGDDEKMTKKEIRESYDNFDEWLRVVAERYKAEYKAKEDSLFD